MRLQVLPDPDPTPNEARRASQRVLERPEFEELEPTVLDRMTDWINERIGRLLGDLVGSSGEGGGVLGWVLMAVLVVIVGYFLLRLLFSLQRSARADEDESIAESQRPPADWLRLAAEHEDRGEWRKAVVAQYRYVIGRLIGGDIASDLPGRTTGEYRADVADNAPRVSADFDQLSDLFDLIWFGDEPASEEDVAVAVDLGRKVLVLSIGREREPLG